MRSHELLVVTWLPDVKSRVEKLLQDNEYVYDSVSSPIEAIDAVGKYAYKVVILDCLLPGLNGYQLVKRLKGTPHGGYAQFIVFMNNIPENKRPEVINRWGMHVLLRKPVNEDDLLASLKQAESYDLPSEKIDQYTSDCVEETFSELAHVLWTGKLTCYGDQGVVKEVYWDSGNPVFAMSSSEDERLDKWLMGKGLVSEGVLTSAYDIMNKRGKRLGDALIILGAISEDSLEHAISDNMKEIILSMFSWDGFTYTKEEKVRGIKEMTSIQDSFPILLFEGIRRKSGIEAIKTKLQETGEIVSFSPDNIFNIEDFKFPQSFNRLMGLINGKRTIYELIAKSGVSHDDAYRFLYTLLLLKLIRLSQTNEENKQVAISMADASRKTKFTGNLHDVSIMELIQMLELNRKSGTLQVHDIHEIGWLLFDKGSIIDAYYGDLTRENAVYRMLFLTEGEFDIKFKSIVGEPRITVDTQTLLMDGLRMLDEVNRIEPLFGSLKKKLVVNPLHTLKTSEEKEELMRIFNGNNDILTSSFLLNPDPQAGLDIISTLLKDKVIKEEL